MSNLKNYCQVCGELIPRRLRAGSETCYESQHQYLARKTCGRGTTCYTTMLSRVQSGNTEIATPIVRYETGLQIGSLKFPRYSDMNTKAPPRWAWYGGIPLTEPEIRASAAALIKQQRNLA